MTNLVEPPRAVDVEDVASGRSLQDGELASLVRRWMAAGSKGQGRGRRDSILRVAPDVEEGPAEPAVYVVGTTPTQVADSLDLIVGRSPRETEPSPSFPPLPRRSTGAEAAQVRRVALLIDARRVSADVASALLARVGERGAVNVCRAYADWNTVELGDWVRQMRTQGLHSFHHYADDDQALVAMTIDAVDIASDAAVDEVVIAGDLAAALPLVHRLHAAGVDVVMVGSGHTPHEVRAACHEFIDTATLDGGPVASAGRHRA